MKTETLAERTKRVLDKTASIDAREKAIIDRHTSTAPSDGLANRTAKAMAQLEIESRRQQRAYSEQAPPEIVGPTIEMLASTTDRNKMLDVVRKLTPEQRAEALRVAPGLAQQLGDDRGGIVNRTFESVSRGIASVSQPIQELVGAGGTKEEIEYIRQLEAAAQEFAPARPDDAWYQRGPLQATEMAPWMVTVAGGAGLGRAAATGVAGRIAARGAAGGKIAGAVTKAGQTVGKVMSAGKAGELAGITTAAFPTLYAQEVDQLKAIGMVDDSKLRLLAGGTAAISGLIEGIVPNPFKVGKVPLSEGAAKAARQYLWEAAKRAPAEMSEEYLQGVTSGLGQHVAQYLDANAEDKSIADAFNLGWEQTKEAALPMAFLLGVPAVGGAGLSAARAQRLTRLQDMLAKGFVSEEEAKQEGIDGKNRKERMANAEKEIQELQKPTIEPPSTSTADPASPKGPPPLPGAPGGATQVTPPPLPQPGSPPALPGTPQSPPPRLPLPSTPTPGIPSPAATPPGATVPGGEAGAAVAGAGKGIVDGLYQSMYERLQAGKYPGIAKTPADDAVAAEHARQPFQTADEIRQFVNDGSRPVIEDQSGTETPTPATVDQPKLDVVAGSGQGPFDVKGKLYRENPNASTPSERLRTRQAIDPSEGVVLVTKDHWGHPISEDTLKARQEFADNAKPGTEFSHKDYTGQTFKVQDDGTLLNSSGRKMNSVQDMANTIKPGDVTWSTKPVPAVDAESKGTAETPETPTPAADDKYPLPEYVRNEEEADMVRRRLAAGKSVDATTYEFYQDYLREKPDRDKAKELYEKHGKKFLEDTYKQEKLTDTAANKKRREELRDNIEYNFQRKPKSAIELLSKYEPKPTPEVKDDPESQLDAMPRVTRPGIKEKPTHVKSLIPKSESEPDMELALQEDRGEQSESEYVKQMATAESVPIERIESGQTIVEAEGVRHFIKNPTQNDLKTPLIIQYGDKMIVRDGNTRVNAAILRGDKSILARVVYVSDKRSSKQPESKWQAETRAKLDAVPALKGSKFEADEKTGKVKVTRPDGLKTTIHFNSDEELAAAAKVKGKKPELIHGWHVVKDGESNIYIKSDANHTNILNHEVMHWLQSSGIVTKEEIDQHGGIEKMANDYGKWAEMKLRKKDSVFQKVYDTLESLFSAQKRFFEEVGKRQAPAKPKSGSARGVMAVMTSDGKVYSDPEAAMHFDVVEKFGLDSSDIIDGGFIIDGKYKMAQSDGGYAATEGEPEQVATVKRYADEYNAEQGKFDELERLRANAAKAAIRGDFEMADALNKQADELTAKITSADQVNVDSGAESKVKPESPADEQAPGWLKQYRKAIKIPAKELLNADKLKDMQAIATEAGIGNLGSTISDARKRVRVINELVPALLDILVKAGKPMAIEKLKLQGDRFDQSDVYDAMKFLEDRGIVERPLKTWKQGDPVKYVVPEVAIEAGVRSKFPDVSRGMLDRAVELAREHRDAHDKWTNERFSSKKSGSSRYLNEYGDSRLWDMKGRSIRMADIGEDTPVTNYLEDLENGAEPTFGDELETLPQSIPAYVISGMQRSPGRIDDQKFTGRPIGVAVGPQRMSDNVVRKVAAHVNRGGTLFVDSGMFGTVSKGEVGEEPNWGNVFNEYSRILEQIEPRNRRNVMLVAPDYLVKIQTAEGKDLVIGDTMRTLELQDKYARQIEELMDEGARIIIPIQRDMSEDPMSLGEIVSAASDPIDLASGNFAWGIPYNAAAWPDEEILAFVQANKNSGMHIHLLGGGKGRAEKLWSQISDIDPTVKLTGDAATEVRNAYRADNKAQSASESGSLSVDEFADIFANPEQASESPTESKPKKPRSVRNDAPRKPKATGEKKTPGEGVQEGLDEAKAGADLIMKGLKDLGSSFFSGPPINRDIAVGMGMMANGLIKAGKYKFIEFVDEAVKMIGAPAVRYLGPYLEAGWNKKAESDNRLDKATSVANYLSEESNDTTRDDNSEAMGDDTPEPRRKPKKGGATGKAPRKNKQPDSSGRGDDEGAGSGSTEDSGGNRDGISSPAGSLNNHQIAEHPDWLEGGPVTKLNRNIDAITTMNRVEAENRRATPDEQAIIAKYTGWGHLKQFFIRDSDLRAIKAVQGDKWNLNAFKTLDARTEEQIREQGRRKGSSDEQIETKIQREKANNKHRIRLATSMTPGEYAQARKSTRYSHYTDPAIARAMWGFINDALPEAGKIRVLEPSEGSGMFWGTMPNSMFKRAEMHGVDMDPSSSRIARHLYPSVRHLNVPFQQSPYPEGFFDLAITNVPFNKNPVQDPEADFDNELSLHNYFFAKTASRLREGGVVVFITTHFTMDAANTKQRSIISDQGLKFLGAVRLNQDAFGNVANTKVTTDIIVMQKVAPGSLTSNNSFERAAVPMVAPFGEETAEIDVHPYFGAKPSMVAGKITANGEMRGADPELTVESNMTPEETAGFISRALGKIEVDKQAFIEGQQHRKDMAEAIQGSTTFVPEHLQNLGVGKLAVDGNNLIVRTSAETMSIVKTDFSPTLKARAEKWFAIRDALTNLQQLQTRSDNPEAEIEEARKELNRVYDDFVGEFNDKKNDYSGYKPLNTTYNKSMFAADFMSASVQALENTKLIPTGELDKDGKEKTRLRVEKASIFTERTEYPLEHRPKPKTVKEALAHSMFTNGGVDIDWIASTLGKSKEEIAKQLEKYAFEVPNDGGWEIKEVYLSGNISKKLEVAEAAAEKNPAFTRNVDALREVLPVPKTFEQLVVYPNSPFLPVDLLREFVADVLGLGAFDLYRNEQELGGGWRANYDKSNDSNKTTEDLVQYAVRDGDRIRKRGFDLFLDMIAGKPTIILDRDADDRTYVNEKLTNLAKSKRLELSRAFDTFIRSDQNRMDAVTNEFNRLLSGYVKPSIPDWVVSFDGMSGNWKDLMRSYQKEAAAKIAMGGNTLLAHRVGYGKTLSGVAGIMEQRRLGVARKPLAVVPNHLTGQWAKAFADFYPSAKVMAPTSKDFEKQNRQATMNRIMTGNWDAIIIPESSFKKLPMSSEYVEQFFQEQIAQSIDAAERARAEEGSDPRSIAELEDVTERLRNQLAKYLAESQKDPGPFFDEMGIDSLTVDEAHHYKNLPFYTQNTRVAGINPTGSQQAFDMLMKTDFINVLTGSRNVTFLTGTPIANSMTEAWVMMRYLMPETMKESNVFAFDDWKNAFGEVVDRTRVNTIGTGFRTESRFQQFVNLDVLAKMFQQVADIQMINNDVQVPPLKGGKPQSIVVPASDAMKNFMLGLAARSANMPQDPSEDNMLNVMTVGAGAAIDFRLLDAAAMPSETSKITVAAEEVAKIFELTTPFKGTQIIWADRGVPKAAKKLTAEMKQLGAWMLEEVQNRPLTMEDIKEKWKELRPTKNASAELQRFMGMALQDMNYTEGNEDDEVSYKVDVKDEPTVWVNEINDIDPNITEQAAPPWNVYQQMKEELIARGIPAEKIAFIHDYKTAAQKVQLWEKMNNGDMRVLLGNTPRLGTGANIQVRLVAAHHLDAPWRPADVEQRDGRIIRSGNRVMTIGDKIGFAEETGVELDGVIINRYVTEGSIDARYWDTNEMKAQMLQDFWSGNPGVSIEELGATTLSMSDVKAAAVANPLLKKKIELEHEVGKLSEEYRGAVQSKTQSDSRLKEAQKEVPQAKKNLDDAKKRVAWWEAGKASLPEGETFGIEIDGEMLFRRDDIAKAIDRKLHEIGRAIPLKVATNLNTDWAKQSSANSSEQIVLGKIFGKKITVSVDGGFRNPETGEVVGGNTWQEKQLAKELKDGSWERSYSNATFRVDGIVGLSRLGTTSQGFAARIRNFVDPGETWVEDHEKALASKEKALSELEKLVKSIPEPDSTKLVEKQQELEEVSNEIGEEDDDQITYWVATEELEKVLGEFTLHDQLGRVDSPEVLLGYISHPKDGKLSVFNRAGDTRPPAHAMVWVEGENAIIGYVPRDDKGVMGLPILKHRMQIGTIQHPEHGELFVFNHKEGDVTQRGQVWVENEDGTQSFGYQDKALNVVMGVEMQKISGWGDWPADIKRHTSQWDQKNDGNNDRDLSDDDEGTITPGIKDPTRQSRTSRRRKPGEAPGIAAADIQKTVEKMFDIAVRQGGFSEKAAGIYKWMTRSKKSPPSPDVVRTTEEQYASLATLSHEVAHHIDETLKVVKNMPVAVKTEVSALDYEPQKARAFEGWAEFFRRYVTEPLVDVNGTMMPNTIIDAPKTTEWFEKVFLPANPELAINIKKFREYAQQWANQSVFARIGTMISDRKPQDLRFAERWKQKGKRWLNRLKSNFLDKFHTLKWIQDEAKEKGYKGTGIYDLTMAYFLSASSHATIAFEEGVRALTGRKIGTTKLWEISRHLENDGEYDEAVRYALARHTLYMDEVKPGYNTGVDVDDAQAWIDEARSLGKADRYERFSKELAQFNDDLIMMLVADGALSSEEADKILNYYRDANGSPHYFPLHRVSDLDGSEFAGTSAGFVNLGPAVKGRSKSGSGRQIIDPLDATVTRAIKFYGRAIQARQAHTLAKTLDPKMGGVGGMGGLMDRIPAKRVVNQGTIEEILGTLVESGTIEEDQARAMRIAARILDPANGGMASQKDLEWFANKHQVVDWENNWSDMEDAAKTEPDALAVISLWRPDYTPSAKKRTVMIYDPNGNKLMYEMDNDLYQVATGMQEVQFNSFMRTLRESARYFKSGAVGLSTGFGTANLLRDYWEFQGKANHVQGLKTLGKPWEMLGRYIAEKTKKSVGMKSNDLLIRLYEESGGKVYSVIGHDADGRSIYRRRKTGKSTMSKLGLSITRPMETAENMLNTLQEFIAISDAPPRMADAEAALAEHGFVIRDGSWFDTKAGVPVDTLPESARIAASVAMAEATINFKRIGAAGQYVEAFFPFFNATIQATYRSYQQIKNLKNIGKDTPEGNRALRTLVYLSAIAATGAFYWLFRHDDDDYRNQDGWLRDGYWTWGENGKTYLRIPKPRDFAVVGNVVENMLDAWAHNDARETSEIFKREIAGRIPTGGGMLRGSVETYVANYDYFRGRELEGESVKDLPKQYRTSSYTSRMSDYLGKHFGKILNTSPIQFEHLLSSASGGMYSRWTDTYDAAQDGRIGPEHVPFARGLMMNRQQTRPVGEFYQKKEELTELAATQKIEQEKVDSDISDKLAHFGWISEVMTALRKGEGKLGKKRSFENEKYITGLARAALGYDEQKSNPNPLSAKDLPEDIRETIDHYRQLAVVGAAERISPRSTYKSDDAYASKLSEIERAESKFKMLNLSLEESKQALIAYWEKQGWPVKEKGVLTDKLQSRFRKLDELFKSK